MLKSTAKDTAPAPIVVDWLEGYNLATEAEEKKQYLDQGLAESASPENLLRKKLWEARFTRSGKITGNDFFLMQWVDLRFNQRNCRGLKKMVNRKSMRSIQKNLMFDEGTTDALREVLYQEYLNIILEYIELCTEDSHYRKTLLGLKTINKATLITRIASDVYNTGVGTPMIYEMSEEYALFSKAARDAFLTVYPKHQAEWDQAAEDFKKKYL